MANKKYQPRTRDELKALCDDMSVNLGDIDTSLITDMSYLFSNSMRASEQFEGIENWDISNVETMEHMFSDSLFKGDLSSWDLSKVKNKQWMLAYTPNNPSNKQNVQKKYRPKTKDELEALCKDLSISLGDIDTSLITDMNELFFLSKREDFSGIDSWDVSNVVNMGAMFEGSNFNENINSWNVSNVKNMSFMFCNTFFNQPLDKWDVSNVEDMSHMFENSAFNQPICNWSVGKVTSMSYMFHATPFNQSIESWNVSNVTTMDWMFCDSDFNQPIGKWDVSKVSDFHTMFCDTSFNQPLNSWNVSNAEDMCSMFQNSDFNQPLSKWNVENVVDVCNMFLNSLFDQDISNWNLASVEFADYMFENSSYHRNIPKLGFKNISTCEGIFNHNDEFFYNGLSKALESHKNCDFKLQFNQDFGCYALIKGESFAYIKNEEVIQRKFDLAIKNAIEEIIEEPL